MKQATENENNEMCSTSACHMTHSRDERVEERLNSTTKFTSV
jgi:hypothetical protein